MNKRKISVVLLSMSLILFAAGCKKKTPPPPPPPPPAPAPVAPAPAKPSVQFSAEPSTIERGQSATLRWSVSDATDVTISPAVGTVSARGDRQVSPTDTTTYTLSAKGPGGTESATATVTVTAPPPPPPPPVVKKSLSDLLSTEVQDAYYDYDKSDVREDARATLTRDADALKRIFADLPDAVVVLEGHCDERGSSEYNLGLGDRRAAAAKEFLQQLGIPADKVKTISYGKERPQCTESNEACYQKNRRAHFSAAQ
jgi:peptidoglycan-associated lipoprotein